MSADPSAGFLADGGDGREGRYRPAFLASNRAVAACTRELARLAEEVANGVAALPPTAVGEKVTVRRSPDRCIVQLGPVALTIAWLRGTHDSVAAGELLVIVWRGAVAPRARHQPERPTTGPAPLGATALWEQVLVAVGDSEETWGWRRPDERLARCSSAELAALCVGRLRAAYVEYVEHDAPPPSTSDAASIT